MGIFGKILDRRKKSQSAHREAMLSAQRLLEDKLIARGRAVLWEFDRLHSSGEPPTSDLGLEKDNKRKNRYCDVLPFDYNCVRLGQERRYINASFLTSKDSEPAQWAYIATQGPLKSTVEDFWQMVLEQRSTAVLMLTRTTENFHEKCATYFPEKQGSEKTYGIYRVQAASQTELDNDITVRELHLSDGVSGESRRIMHYHYHAWPDHGVPESTEPLRRLSQLLRRTKMEGSPVVHCSAGIGRTGTFCAVDITLRKLLGVDPSDVVAAEKAVDVKRVVTTLRKQRYGMVQNPSQYLFCHQAIKEEIDELLNPTPSKNRLRVGPAQPGSYSFTECMPSGKSSLDQ